ncbi:unnamed protein product (macronuclear) [Paramecium tetraurelia]|uniref:Uncharacterized protein n=1 Tax=Paramecium tetraurelia TaxID=5888 RepID=A0CJ85_PARTE|nr:uncharacterized protein GSPATT00038634001 [Paramecium tetraurelia]CAK70852.1 unnamed protein product [Paramecium tetraurelia]|eukprot:XP_001438249.1 hypothetical protein (macronuclear) [Paramecium tetraurelia strain d4-2]
MNKQRRLDIGLIIDLEKQIFSMKDCMREVKELGNGRYLNLQRIDGKNQVNQTSSFFGSYNGGEKSLKNGEWTEIIEFHEHQGKYENGKKVGRWKIRTFQSSYGENDSLNSFERKWLDEQYQSTYENIKIRSVGGLFQNGIKIGTWLEPDSYKLTISYGGEYRNGKKVGLWTIEHCGKHIGGGEYSNEGNDIKIGKWIEFVKLKSMFLYEGEYKKGKKVGLWTLRYCHQSWETLEINNNQICGGGVYCDEGDGIKIGRWIEVSNNLHFENNLHFWNGVFKNGKKIGRWDSTYTKNTYTKINPLFINGGSYSQEGDEIKIGKWIEFENRKGAFIYSGVYQQGKKVGNWDISCTNWQSKENSFTIIGGGSYDEKENFFKTGQWCELRSGQYDYFTYYLGQYKNDKKIGWWDILVKDASNRYEIQSKDSGYRNNKGLFLEIQGFYGQAQLSQNVGTQYNQDQEQEQYIFIGGGQYDIKGLKIGQWLDFNEMIVDVGQYLNGEKMGQWNSWSWSHSNKNYTFICEGQYQKDCKIGKWIANGNTGQYSKNNKVGMWNNQKPHQWSYYDSNGIKIFSNPLYLNESKAILWEGEFKDSKKIGRWDILLRSTVIGGGSYDNEGSCMKIGKWIEISYEQNIFCGEYKDNKKIGYWEEYDNQMIRGNCKQIEIISNIYYSQSGIRIFRSGKPDVVLWVGEFIDNKKIGRWNILYKSIEGKYKELQTYKNTSIIRGGGFYDNEGMKIGKWVEQWKGLKTYAGVYKNNKKIGLWKVLDQDLISSFRNYDDKGNVIYSSEELNVYSWGGLFNGKIKIGRWDILFKAKRSTYYKEIGGGSYDSDGSDMKIGKWIELKDEYNIYCGEYKDNKKIGLWKEQTQDNGEIISFMNYDDEGDEIFRKGLSQ